MSTFKFLGAAAVVLAGAAATARAPAKYEVRLAYVGYTGLAESRDCDIKVNAQGYDSLIGAVSTIEPDGKSDDDVVYVGTFQRVTKIDYCQSRGRKSSQDDEQVWCLATLTGRAKMEVEITVYGEEGRGAWIKARPVAPKADSVAIAGDCNQKDMEEIRQGYPGGQSAGSPDGQAIAEPAEGPKFIVGEVPRLRVGDYPAEEGGWGLRVVRTLPCRALPTPQARATGLAAAACE